MKRKTEIYSDQATTYKYKSIVFDYEEYLGPTILSHRSYIPKDSRQISLRLWGEFCQWYRLSKDERNQYRVNTTPVKNM